MLACPLSQRADTPRSGSGTGPERALERRHPDPPLAAARKLSRPQRSLRAQARSREAPTHDSPQAPAQRPNHQAAAGPGRSEHWNVDILIPLARQRDSSAGPNVPCERRTDPAEPRRGTNPQRQPRHSATVKQVGAPGYTAFLQNAPLVRHTRGLTPGWYAVPRWGTPNASPSPEPPCAGLIPQSTPKYAKRQRDRAGASIGSDQTSPSRTARKPHPPPSFPARAGPIPRSLVEAVILSASPGTRPPQNRWEHQGMRRSFRTHRWYAIPGV